MCKIKHCRCQTRKADGKHVSLNSRDFERFNRGKQPAKRRYAAKSWVSQQSKPRASKGYGR